MSGNKQMRISDAQYKRLGDLAKQLGMRRSELINSAVDLVQLLLDNETKDLKIVDKEGNEKSVALPILYRQ